MYIKLLREAVHMSLEAPASITVEHDSISLFAGVSPTRNICIGLRVLYQQLPTYVTQTSSLGIRLFDLVPFAIRR